MVGQTLSASGTVCLFRFRCPIEIYPGRGGEGAEGEEAFFANNFVLGTPEEGRAGKSVTGICRANRVPYGGEPRRVGGDRTP